MTLAEWVTEIEHERPFVDRKPYSHNIISLALAAIAKEYGREVANRVVDECNLEELGWYKEPL